VGTPSFAGSRVQNFPIMQLAQPIQSPFDIWAPQIQSRQSSKKSSSSWPERDKTYRFIDEADPRFGQAESQTPARFMGLSKAGKYKLSHRIRFTLPGMGDKPKLIEMLQSRIQENSLLGAVTVNLPFDMEVDLDAGYWPKMWRTIVSRVRPGSNAEKVGLKAGDIIRAVSVPVVKETEDMPWWERLAQFQMPDTDQGIICLDENKINTRYTQAIYENMRVNGKHAEVVLLVERPLLFAATEVPATQSQDAAPSVVDEKERLGQAAIAVEETKEEEMVEPGTERFVSDLVRLRVWKEKQTVLTEQLGRAPTIYTWARECDFSSTQDFKRELKQCEASRTTLIESAKGMVYQVAKKYKKAAAYSVPQHDLVQAGMVGLINAVDSYDPDNKIGFRNFMYTKIRDVMYLALLDRNVQPGKETQRLNRKRFTTTQELKAELGRKPSADEVAARIGVTEKRVHKLKNTDVTTRLDSGNRRGNEEAGGTETLKYFNWDEEAGGIEVFDAVGCSKTDRQARELREQVIDGKLKDVLEKLTPEQRAVLEMRTGLDDGKKKTYNEIGRRMGVSYSKAKDLFEDALYDLRAAAISAKYQWWSDSLVYVDDLQPAELERETVTE